MSVRDRLYERKFAWHMRVLGTYKRVRIARWYPEDHRVYTGTASLHRTPAARKINLLQRLRINRCK